MGLLEKILPYTSLHTPGDGIPIREAAYVIVDTELTGLDMKKDSIVSMGAVRVRDGRILLGETYYNVAKPSSTLTRDSVVIHGITPSDVADRQPAADVLTEFARFCGGDIIVGHCVSLDMGFIGRGLELAGLPRMTNKLVDTFGVHGWLRRNDPAYSRMSPGANASGLYDIAGCLGIPVSGAHNALMDAFITAQVFQAFLPLLQKAGVTTTDRLISISDQLKGGDGFYSPGVVAGF